MTNMSIQLMSNIGNNLYNRSPLTKIEDKEVVASIVKKFRSLKRHLTTLVQSIFDNIDSMPMGLRLLCKLIHLTVKNRVYYKKETQLMNFFSSLIWMTKSITKSSLIIFLQNGSFLTIVFLAKQTSLKTLNCLMTCLIV